MASKLTINIKRRPRKNQQAEKLFSLEEDLIVEEGRSRTLDIAIRKVQNHYGRIMKPFEFWSCQNNDDRHQSFRFNPKGENTYATIIIDAI